jgi:hypothetical protein
MIASGIIAARASALILTGQISGIDRGLDARIPNPAGCA